MNYGGSNSIFGSGKKNSLTNTYIKVHRSLTAFSMFSNDIITIAYKWDSSFLNMFLSLVRRNNTKLLLKSLNI